MSGNENSDGLFCSFINAEDEDTRFIRGTGGLPPLIPRGERMAAAFKCCQACAWREEQLRQESRLKKQTLPQKLGQKIIDSFLLNGSIAFTTQEIAAPLFGAVLVLLLCDKRNLVQGFGLGDVAADSDRFQMASPRVLGFVFLLIAFPAVLMFNVIKARISRSAGLTTQQLKKFRDLYLPKDNPQNQARKLKYANILSKAIQCKTVSSDIASENKQRNVELKKLHNLLAESFPTVYEKCPPIIINDYSLIFKIPGQDPKKKPIMLCSHLDVVPAPINDDYPWIREPFSGDIVNGIIHGRGAIDNKHNVVGQLGAMEEILRAGNLPKRTTYITMGHDEEIEGFDGAAHIARYFQEQKVKFEFILDEGTMMISGAVPGIKKDENIAIVGCVEKGKICVELSVTGPGGHSSLPPIDEENPLKIMGKAIVALESNPVPAHFEEGTMFRNTMEDIAWKMSFPLNVICTNFWLFGGLFKQILLRASNGAAASIRTTTVVAKVRGGDKFNVIPSEVKAIVNHRIHPNDTVQTVLEHDRRVIDDSRVKLRLLGGRYITQPSPITNYKSRHFNLIRDTVETIYGTMSVPGIMVGNTDTRWYWELSDQIFRFSPVKLTMAETKMFHGVNEKISIDALVSIVDFYKAFVMLVDDKDESDDSNAINEMTHLMT